MTDLSPCPACRRHVRVDEAACPFCAATLAPVEPRALATGRLTRAAVFAGAAIASTAAGCGGKAKPADDHTQVENVAADAGTPEQPIDAGTPEGPDYPDHAMPMPYGAPPVRVRVV